MKVFKQSHQAGFTLLELMITVVVIGILGAVAYPSYASYVVKGKRTECRSAVMQNMMRQERVYTTSGSYTTSTTGMLTFSGDSLAKSACTIASEQCTSTVALTSCVRVRATPANYTDPEVGQIHMDSSSNKSCTGTNLTRCWN